MSFKRRSTGLATGLAEAAGSSLRREQSRLERMPQLIFVGRGFSRDIQESISKGFSR
jgi:hypothetical protein